MKKLKNKFKYIVYTTLLMLSFSAISHEEAGIVVKIVDGDTIKIKHEGKIHNYRLAGIDTPETYNNRKAKKDIQACGIPKEQMFMLGNAAKEKVAYTYKLGDVIYYDVIDIGVYGRPIIWINGLNVELVEKGYARVVDYRNLSSTRMGALKEAEFKAKSLNLGIWKLLICWR